MQQNTTGKLYDFIVLSINLLGNIAYPFKESNQLRQLLCAENIFGKASLVMSQVSMTMSGLELCLLKSMLEWASDNFFGIKPWQEIDGLHPDTCG